MLGDCSIRVLADCSIRVSRSCITRTHTSNCIRPPRRPQEAIGRHSRALCAWPYAFSKICDRVYHRVYAKANGGPLMAEGDQLWQRKLSGGGQVAALQVVRGTKYGCCNWSGGPILGGPVVA